MPFSRVESYFMRRTLSLQCSSFVLSLANHNSFSKYRHIYAANAAAMTTNCFKQPGTGSAVVIPSIGTRLATRSTLDVYRLLNTKSRFVLTFTDFRRTSAFLNDCQNYRCIAMHADSPDSVRPTGIFLPLFGHLYFLYFSMLPRIRVSRVACYIHYST